MRSTSSTSSTVPQASFLNARDLINVGVFTAIYFVLMFSFGMMGLFGPWLSGVGFALGILANGVVVALYLSRVPKLGALTVMGVILGLLMIVTGHPWFGVLLSGSLGLISDLIARVGNHRRPLFNIIAYAVLSLWYLGPMLPVAWDTAGYREYVAESMGEGYADVYLQVFGASALPFWALGFFCFGLIGGWFGQSVLRRQFSRAGVA